MKKQFVFAQIQLLLFCFVFASTGWGQGNQLTSEEESQTVEYDCALQISDYVRKIFQDKQRNFWFDTHGRGICRFDGNSLAYFSTNEGFGGIAVRSMAEDKEGNVYVVEQV